MPTHTNDRLVFWTGIAGQEELRLKYADLLKRLNSGELASLDFEELHSSSAMLKGTSTVRINGKDRLLIKPIPVDGETYILILEEILEHRHDKAAHLNGTNRERENRLSKLIASLKETDFVKITNFKAFERTNAPAPVDKEHKQEPKYPTYHNGEYVLLTDQQSQALELDMPFWAVAEAGYGKTLFAAEYMRKWMDKLTQSFKPRSLAEIKREVGEQKPAQAPITMVYVAKNQILVDKFKENYLQHPLSILAYRNIDIQFKTLDTLCRDNLLDPTDRQHESVGQDAFFQWLKQNEQSFDTIVKTKTKGNPSTETVDRHRIFAKPDLLYKEFCHMVVLDEGRYLAEGIPVRGTKDYFTAEERPFLWELCHSYISSLEKTGKYDLALNPPLLKSGCNYVIVADEVQTLAPKEIELITALAKDNETRANATAKQLLLLYGKNQSRILCNRSYFKTLDLHTVRFTKSLRNPHDVTLMANNALKALLNFGKLDKEKEFQAEIMEPNPDKKGEIYWADDLRIPDAMIGDPNLTIVTQPEYVAEAKKRFNTSFVFSPEQIQGLDYDNLVLYKMFSSPIFDAISAHLPEETGE